MKRSRLGIVQRFELIILLIVLSTKPLSSIKTMPFSSSANAKYVLSREVFSLSGIEKVTVSES